MEQALSPLRPLPPVTVLALVESAELSQALPRLAAGLGTNLEVCTTLAQARARATQDPHPAVIVAEQSLGTQESLALLEGISPYQRLLRVIYLTDQPEPAVVVEAMRRGAYGIYERPLSEAALRGVLEAALDDYRRRLLDQQFLAEYLHRLGQLSDAEREVLEAVYEGKLNKQIARELGVSVRTVEQRRRRLFEKMSVTSAVPLASEVATARTLLRVYGNGSADDAKTIAFALPAVAGGEMPTH